MNRITSFSDLRKTLSYSERPRVAVAGGNSLSVVQAIVDMLDTGLVASIVVTGDAKAISKLIPSGTRQHVRLVDATDAVECATRAVSIIRDGEADLLMKGHVDSTSYLRAIVDRTNGIRPENAVLSNLTIAQMPSLPGFIGATDNGIIPTPDLAAKRQILLNARALYRGLGIDPIKVAVVAATEKVSAKQPATADAASLAEEFGPGKHAGMIVDGPFGYDAAVSVDAATAKKLQSSPVAGNADLLLFPTIEAANAVAKSWKFHGSAETGSVVAGARVPVMLNSRSDGAAQRVNSLLLAMAMQRGTLGDA